MAGEPNPVGVHFGAGLQVSYGGFRVRGEIGGGGLVEIAARSARATVVGPQYDDAFARQIVGQHQEGLVSHEAFVAILLARARDQHHRRKRALALRDGQGASQFYAGALIRVLEVFGTIGVRLHGVLRGARFLRLRARAPLQQQRKGAAALRESAIDRGEIFGDGAHIFRSQAGYFEREHRTFAPGRRRDPRSALVGTVQGCGQAILGGSEVDHQSQLLSHVENALPGAVQFGWLRGAREVQRKRLALGPGAFDGGPSGVYFAFVTSVDRVGSYEGKVNAAGTAI